MIRKITLLVVSSLLLLLTACQQSEKENLVKFVANSNKMKAKEIEPLPSIKPIEPYAYSAQEYDEPFDVENLKPRRVISARTGGGPDTNRRREPLENYPLDSLTMVGTLFRETERRVIIQTPEGAVQTAVVGNYLGQNYGKIISIDENEVAVEEQVLNSAGAWVGRDARIKVDQ
ncbi:MAG: pilus assembly protein PilP [Gammaproteobacteria bacterium]|nr:pilus assembly protein PilP [Gammaproteobacteria bacterium]